MKWKWRYLLLFFIPLLLTRSISPDLQGRQFLNGKEIKEVPEGSYILSNFEIQRMKEEYVEFSNGDQSFWGKVPPKVDLPDSSSMQLTVLKNGHFVEVISAKSMDYEKKEFSVYGSKKGKILLNIEGDLRAIDSRPPCHSGTLLVSESDIKEVICSSQSY